MKNNLWKSSEKLVKNSNLNNFEKFISNNHSISFNNDYKKICKWSVENLGEFWKSIWNFGEIKGKLG